MLWLWVQLLAALGHRLHLCQQKETIITKLMSIRKCDHCKGCQGRAVFLMPSYCPELVGDSWKIPTPSLTCVYQQDQGTTLAHEGQIDDFRMLSWLRYGQLAHSFCHLHHFSSLRQLASIIPGFYFPLQLLYWAGP